MSTNSPQIEITYPSLPINEFSDWVERRKVFLFGSSDGLTRLDSSLPPLSKLILITSDNGNDSLFFATEEA